uniref:DNA N(6)-methyladenine demethylase n=1 Tax=Kalanchoe fedtschenkoi TaxID=63787 RepID=A0A7N0RH62_KALFE
MSDRHINFGYEGGRGNSYRQGLSDAPDENNRYLYNENSSGNRGMNGQKKEYFDRNKNYGGEVSRGNSGKQVWVYVPVGIKEGQFDQGEGAPDAACSVSSSLDVSSGLVNDIGICVPSLSDQSRPGIRDIDVSKIQISENPIKGVDKGTDSIKESQRSVNVPLGEFFQPLKPGMDAKPCGNKKHVSETSSIGNVSGIRCSESSEARQGYDICFLKTGAPFTLKPSLLEVNKEKRKEMKKAVEGKRGEILGPGLILLKNHLSIHEQAQIVSICRTLGRGPGGFYQPGYKDGAKLHLKMMCLGKNWDPETSQYVDVRPVDGAKPPLLPSEFNQWVHRSIQESHKLIREAAKNAKAENTLPSMSPDLCIVNFYTSTGKLGLHQDRDESEESRRKGLPVVSFSIGDSAEFLYSDQRDVDKAEKVLLESGDILIFGGESRHIFHGVERILPDTAPKSLLEETNLLRPGRLNLTFRKY